jgi:hypothetical protein
MIQAEATRCERLLFHAHVRLPEGEALGRDQWLYVADRIERQLGFEGQGRAVSFHQDRSSDERHLHVAWVVDRYRADAGERSRPLQTQAQDFMNKW